MAGGKGSQQSKEKGGILGTFVGRDLRSEIAAAGMTPGQGQGERKAKSNGSEENERQNTSGVIEEESIVKSIEKIIDSEEAKELSGSPEHYHMVEEDEEEEKTGNNFIKIINDEQPKGEEELDAEMQIPSE